MTKSESFFDIFNKKNLENMHMLNSYINDSSEKNIHDIRISIRRLESVYVILPNSSKTKISDKYIQQLKHFFSLSNKIRDYDIILKKLNEYGHDPESKLVLTLMKKKFKRIIKSLTFAEKLLKFKKLKIKHKKINLKFERKILSLINDFRNSIPIVINDESKVNELHSMRKIIKKLRYILETDPRNSHQNIISKMKQLQKILGNIHDCDITVWYLQKNEKKFSNLSEMINSEKSKRHILYRELTTMLSSFESKEKN
ncbi:MAG: CHAD domain-containing protein [Nitrosopumilus sp.]|uniref:CHAD domain-containing protein n=1 Tax=Nitrosopumilus sp. TaxID=2024843 RepID=UPI0029317FA4|nr:CHAD domain-containing protein [Nitrosopumilus sp.]